MQAISNAPRSNSILPSVVDDEKEQERLPDASTPPRPTASNAKPSTALPSAKTVALEQALSDPRVDVMAMATLVMMDGAEQQDAMLRDMLGELEQSNQEKQRLRADKTRAAEQDAALDHALQIEFHSLQAAGLVHSTNTFEQYASWRQITLGEDDHASLGTTPTADDIPEWIAKGTTGTAVQTDNEPLGDKARRFGVPMTVMRDLFALYQAEKTAAVVTATFGEWLVYPVCLNPARSAAEVKLNRDALSTFLQRHQPADKLVKSAAPSTTPVPADLQAAARDYAEAVALRSVFGALISQNKIDEAERKLRELTTNNPNLTENQARAFNAWFEKDLATEMKTTRKRYETARDALTDPVNYELDKNASVYHADDGADISIAEGKKEGRLAIREGHWDRIAPHLDEPKRNAAVESWGAPSQFTIAQKDGQMIITGTRDASVAADGLFPHDLDWTLHYTFANGDAQGVFADLLEWSNGDKQPIEVSSLAADNLDITDLHIEAVSSGTSVTDAALQTRADLVAAIDTATRRLSDTVASSDWDSVAAKAQEEAADPTPIAQMSPRGVRLTLAELKARQKQIDDQIDNLKDLTETSQMRVQRALDARSKLYETLSNLLKSDASLSRSIRENTK